MRGRPDNRITPRVRATVVFAATIIGCGAAAAAAPQTAAASRGTAVPAASGATAAAVAVPHVSGSQAALAACARAGDFLQIAGQGNLCEHDGSFVMRMQNGARTLVSAPDSITAVTRHAAVTPAPAAPLLGSQCVDPSTHPHVELYYAHFSDQPDNLSQHVADIQQMFRDVDANYLNYDASTYFGVGAHLYVECDQSGNPVVHDIALSTPLGNSTFDSIITDMSNQGHKSNLAHYWIWTDGNPEAAYGYAGQSTIAADDSPLASNQINSVYEYSINYGFSDANSGAQVFAHENGHAMGAVQLSALHTTGAYHCTDGYDVMCYNDGGPHGSSYTNTACAPAPNGTLIFDCHFDDYFNPAPATGSYLATHWDVANANNHWLFLQPAASSASLSVSNTSPVYSQPVSLSATVSPVSSPHPGTPTGTVTFSDSGTSIGTANVASNGVATLVTSSLGTGTHSISASYNGSGVYTASSTGSTTVTVSQAQSATSVSSSANPSPLGSPVTVTVTVAPVSPATGAPTGSVTLYDGGNSLGSASLSNGSASFSETLSYGSHSLYATYAGDANFLSSNDSGSQYVQQVLYAAAMTISSSASNDTAEYGTSLTFSATVDAGAGTPGNQGPPTGSVTFMDGGTPLAAPVALQGDATTLTTSSLAPGTQDVYAEYNGDSAYAPAGAELTETVTTFTSMYELSAYGALDPVSSPQLAQHGAVWPTWNIARGMVFRADGQSGYMLDGFGGLHPFGGAPAATGVTGYWPGWDIARGVALRANGTSGYVLDAYGGLHPFGGAPAVTATVYWPGWDIARGLVLRADGQSGYVLDGFGGVHPFGARGDIPASPAVSTYWRGWDIARGLVLDSSGGGYVLDGFGGVHPFGGAPNVATTAYWRGWDIARSIVELSGPMHMGYVLDGWGGLHPFGGAPRLGTPASAWSPGRDVMRAIAVH